MAASTVERTAFFADIASSTRMVVEEGDDTGRAVLPRDVGMLADAARPRVELGRDPASDVHVASSGVSCLHAVVGRSAGMIVRLRAARPRSTRARRRRRSSAGSWRSTSSRPCTST